MRKLYGHGHSAVKTKWYDVWNPPGATSVFSVTDKRAHSFLRKRIAGAFSMSSILKYEQYIQSCLDLLLQKLEKYADSGEVFDMAVWINCLAFDVIGELAYGQELGHLRTKKDVNGLRKSMFQAFSFLATMGHYPLIVSILNNKTVVDVFTGPFGDFRIWSKRQVEHRLEHLEDVEREDMLSHFCRMKNADGIPVPQEDTLIEAMSLVGAGANNTSIGMKACLYYLATSPKYYRLVQDEVDDFCKKHGTTKPITYSQTQQSPILQAVIKEATRLLPSIVSQLPRYAPENLVVRDYDIPVGTPVGISPLAQNRDPEIWSDNADEFHPGRWLEDETKARYFDPVTMTFGGNGPRMCVGINIALVEIHKFVAQFMHKFDFRLPDPSTPWRITAYWFAMQHDFKMKITLRNGGLMSTSTGTDAQKKV